MNGTSLVQSNDVPFVKTIGVVTHTAANEWIEEITSNELPDFLGASAEFIPVPSAIYASDHNLDVLAMWNANTNSDSLLIGYLAGGIRSSASTIFWVNTGVESSANSTIYEVWLTANSANSVVSQVSDTNPAVQLYPNPTAGPFKIDFQCTASSTVQLVVLDSEGRKVMSDQLGRFSTGKHTIEVKGKFLNTSGVYTVQLIVNGEIHERKLVVTE
jgi:hypothetical protein